MPVFEDEDLNQRWQTILGIRSDVTRPWKGLARRT